LVKEKRRAKKDKRKERERAEAEGSGDDEDAGEGLEFVDGGEDAMANFMADAAFASEEERDQGDASESEEEQPRKKQKKWFQRDMPEEAPQGRREIETMDDLEAEAARLLG